MTLGLAQGWYGMGRWPAKKLENRKDMPNHFPPRSETVEGVGRFVICGLESRPSLHRPIKPGTLKGRIEQVGRTEEAFVAEL